MRRRLNDPIFPTDVVTAVGNPQRAWLNAQQDPAVARTNRIPLSTALVNPWVPQKTREDYERRDIAMPGGASRYTRQMDSYLVEDPTVDSEADFSLDGVDDETGYHMQGLTTGRTNVEAVSRKLTETAPSEERFDDLVSGGAGRCSVVARSGNEDADGSDADVYNEVALGDVASAPTPAPTNWSGVLVAGAVALGLWLWLSRK